MGTVQHRQSGSLEERRSPLMSVKASLTNEAGPWPRVAEQQSNAVLPGEDGACADALFEAVTEARNDQ